MKKKIEYLTSGQTAEALGVTIMTVNNWAKKGVLNDYALVPGGWRRFKKTEIENFAKGFRENEKKVIKRFDYLQLVEVEILTEEKKMSMYKRNCEADMKDGLLRDMAVHKQDLIDDLNGISSCLKDSTAWDEELDILCWSMTKLEAMLKREQ